MLGGAQAHLLRCPLRTILLPGGLKAGWVVEVLPVSAVSPMMLPPLSLGDVPALSLVPFQDSPLAALPLLPLGSRRVWCNMY